MYLHSSGTTTTKIILTTTTTTTTSTVITSKMSARSYAASTYTQDTLYTLSTTDVKEGYEPAQAPTQKKSKRAMLKQLFTIPPGIEQTVEGRMHRARLPRQP